MLKNRLIIENLVDIDYTANKIYLNSSKGALVLFDFKAAFPSISHKYMWAILLSAGIPPNVVEAYKKLYVDNHHTLNVGGRNFADRSSPLRGELFHVLKEFLPPAGTRVDELAVDQALACDHVCHGEEEGHVGADPDREVKVRHAGERNLAGIGHDHPGSAGESLLQAGGSDRVTLGHVGADAENDIRVLHVAERVAHCASSYRGGQTGHRGGVSGT